VHDEAGMIQKLSVGEKIGYALGVMNHAPIRTVAFGRMLYGGPKRRSRCDRTSKLSPPLRIIRPAGTRFSTRP
jgi:hypothetical protein